MTTHDFEDGNGPVPAHQHPNGGGWVANTATVDDSVFVAGAHVFGHAKITGNARVFTGAKVFGHAVICENAWVFGPAKVHGNAKVFGDAQVFGMAEVYGNAEISGTAKMYGEIKAHGTAKINEGYHHTGNINGNKIKFDPAINPNDGEVYVSILDVIAALEQAPNHGQLIHMLSVMRDVELGRREIPTGALDLNKARN